MDDELEPETEVDIGLRLARLADMMLSGATDMNQLDVKLIVADLVLLVVSQQAQIQQLKAAAKQHALPE